MLRSAGRNQLIEFLTWKIVELRKAIADCDITQTALNKQNTSDAENLRKVRFNDAEFAYKFA